MVNTESTVELKSFKTHFWNSEVGNYSGFSELVKHCNQGRILSKEYIEFLRQRSQIEDQYGKALQKLAKTSCGGEELVGGRKLWESLKNHTETVGLAHSQASLQLENELVNLAEYLEEGMEKKRWSEENVRSLQAQLKTAYKRQHELRKVYEARCREEVQTSHAYHQEVARGGLESGAAEKAAARHSKVRSSMESAETAYRGSVDYVEEVREQWEKETELAADILQDLEQRRLSVLRDSVWKLSNILSATCVADDEVYEETRVVLEQLDLKECIQLFINQHQTGTSKPGCLQPETLPNSSTIGMGHARYCT
ncbi:proline-serine-threonine phosphatase-interacting protein 1 [Eurytemora carolleeae]|uniref:proline-serine-threonine phosphatase-interacting protein 1 n=1 Tax=Eurytemora carolleeae TaxID=1294199 RepID=UPI000C7739A4|nr:proline-serine-threonine phosphatase-interacting protein 1 [Eurytemora carolleeae]|eukprot:XP_023332653.1 proline-serine-threonine phosphatase-interacting protein 1-like [Eurytemora affinis]